MQANPAAIHNADPIGTAMQGGLTGAMIGQSPWGQMDEAAGGSAGAASAGAAPGPGEPGYNPWMPKTYGPMPAPTGN